MRESKKVVLDFEARYWGSNEYLFEVDIFASSSGILWTEDQRVWVPGRVTIEDFAMWWLSETFSNRLTTVYIRKLKGL